MSANRRLAAFSLLEMLVVMGILGTVMVFLVPITNDILRASRITTATNQTIGLLANAKQVAVTRDRTVEVRFYRYGSSGESGEQANDPASGKFRAIQLFEYDGEGFARPVSKVERLPDGVVFDSGATLSSLLGESQRKEFTASSGRDPKVALPKGVGEEYDCRAYQIKPSGSTSLGFGKWFVTLHPLSAGDSLSAPKGNYATIVVDSISGATSVFRP